MNDGTDYFVPNPYSWNLRANLLYLEAPAGVGYSVCGDTVNGCHFDDET